MSDPSTEPVISEVRGKIGVIVINRPEVRNALDPEVELAIEVAARALAAREDVGALVILGAGGSFCSGVDFARLTDSRPAHGGYNPASHLRFLYLTQLAKPVCAAIQGPCLGSGLALALHCDVRFASRSARFKLPFADLGLVGEMGIPWLLSRLAGPAKAAEWLFSRRMVGFDEAKQCGLVNLELDEAGFADSSVSHLDRWVDGASAYSLGVIKRQIWESFTSSLAQAEYQSGADTRAAISRPEYTERVASLLERMRTRRA